MHHSDVKEWGERERERERASERKKTAFLFPFPCSVSPHPNQKVVVAFLCCTVCANFTRQYDSRMSTFAGSHFAGCRSRTLEWMTDVYDVQQTRRSYARKNQSVFLFIIVNREKEKLSTKNEKKIHGATSSVSVWVSCIVRLRLIQVISPLVQ